MVAHTTGVLIASALLMSCSARQPAHPQQTSQSRGDAGLERSGSNPVTPAQNPLPPSHVASDASQGVSKTEASKAAAKARPAPAARKPQPKCTKEDGTRASSRCMDEDIVPEPF